MGVILLPNVAVLYTSFVHSESPFCGLGLGVFLAPAGPFTFSNTHMVAPSY